MRICHSLLGESVDVEEQELQWRKPVDIVRQCARDHWHLDVDDLIVLASGGAVVAPGTTAEELGGGGDVFIFLRSELGPKASAADTGAAVRSLQALEEDGAAEEGALGEEEVAALDALALTCPSAGDPALETLHGNAAAAGERLAKARPAVALASKLQAKAEVQRLAAQAVLDNLASHRATCARSMELFRQKHDKVQGRFDLNLGHVEDSMSALRCVPLHPALRSPGRETLADALPQEKISRFTVGVQAERARLAQRLEKLQQEDVFAQKVCDQVAAKVRDFLQDDSVPQCAAAVRRQHARALEDLVPALRFNVAHEGEVVEAALVLEEERRTACILDDLAVLCQDIKAEQVELHVQWEKQRASFLQRLWEVSCAQSKVRGVERQAALLEEAINAQHSHAQQLNHLQKMPKAYQRALEEVDRRRQFRARYVAQMEQARAQLAKMMEDENGRRRSFFLRHGCHLPVDLVQGLHSLVPPVSLEVTDFDIELPDLGGSVDQSQSATSASTRRGAASMRQSESSTSAAASSAVGGGLGGASGEDHMRESESRNLELEAQPANADGPRP